MTTDSSIFWPNACLVCGTLENLENPYDHVFKTKLSKREGDVLYSTKVNIPASFRVCKKCNTLIGDYIESAPPKQKQKDKISGSLFFIGIITGLTSVVLFFLWSFLFSVTGLTMWSMLPGPLFLITILVICLSCAVSSSDDARYQLRMNLIKVFMDFEPELEIGLRLGSEDIVGPHIILNVAFTNRTYLALFEGLNLRKYIFRPGSFFDKLSQLGVDVGFLLDSQHLVTKLKTDIDPEVKRHILSQVPDYRPSVLTEVMENAAVVKESSMGQETEMKESVGIVKEAFTIRCSECGHEIDLRQVQKVKFHICPNCGHLQEMRSE